ncbi:non-specific lipid-transfer protein 3-like [Senna tora]|uniref:Non-specific lipid-transfer protein n=1 Tax=Senna tora TaxID=362788 RepID=A0A834TPI4_9FABA|nr:non-specific lipid-transfer protein 3-like [Senna tora]
MGGSIMVRLFLLAIVCVALASPKAEAAVTCTQVYNNLSPCISYVANGGAVPDQCCRGIRTLFGMAQTTPDRQAVCSCIKTAVNGIPYNNNNLNLAAGLPKKCGVNIPYQISPSTDLCGKGEGVTEECSSMCVNKWSEPTWRTD